jgi:hypothetical protein
MEFEIKQKIDFEVEDLAGQAIDVVADFLSDCEPNYRKLDACQRYELLKAVFSRTFELLKEED